MCCVCVHARACVCVCVCVWRGRGCHACAWRTTSCNSTAHTHAHACPGAQQKDETAQELQARLARMHRQQQANQGWGSKVTSGRRNGPKITHCPSHLKVWSSTGWAMKEMNSAMCGSAMAVFSTSAVSFTFSETCDISLTESAACNQRHHTRTRTRTRTRTAGNRDERWFRHRIVTSWCAPSRVLN